ncbi:Fet3 ferroxidase [Coniophora puteana RWD-64-598 SS2]|uniref:Fet3 ferroxidase n=1 Tax=Coniophora puteana (strain RWD-64-598) TaxID=741705 RepID=A0A5M3MCU5_CONPW|nr:Fet3 ferroxidase [Coniophora puteana RWD-64-598 SS2]EIW77038.1 Fet3 ferroxidase [Coniophora puteana RWD-64-598 SS2]
MARLNPFVLFLALASPVIAGVQDVWWNITYVEDVNPDGLYPRRVIGVNNTWPPTPLNVQETDSLVLHVLNSLDVPTTVHHHGQYFNSTSWFDGALGVGQCGIPPGQTFDYVVPINSSGQTGTYWAHAHATGQYVDGLRTPLVLHPTQEHYQYDEEYTIAISDWYHQEHSVLLAQFVNIANPGGAEPIPDSALMYFAQNTTYLPPISGTHPTGPTAGVGFNENATLPFEAGKTYRLRVINMSAFVGFYFWIDGHNMTLIEADGTSIQEYPTDQVMLSVAQRYSMLVTARNDTSGSWAIHFNMDTTMLDTVPDDLVYNLTSSISYGNEPSTPTDLGFVDSYNYLNDTLLTPVNTVAQLPPSSETLNLTFEFDTMNDGTNHAVINGITYNTPLVPAVMSALSLGDNATVQSAYGPSSFVVHHLDVYDILVHNSDTGNHPFHLHGHTFQVINIATQYNVSDLSLNPPVQEGQANPMRRDTIMIPAGGSVTLRVVADNPGVWFFHCHIDWHLSTGLAIQIIEAPQQMQERAQGIVPQYMYDQCQTLGTPYQGNAAGHFSTTDLSGWFLGPYEQELGWLKKGILAMFGCVLTACLGMLTVMWYSLGTQFTDEEVEEAVKARIEAKAKRGKLFGLIKPKQD